MLKKIELSIVILNYNTRDFLKQCLESTGKRQKGGYEIETIVVDNASNDDSSQMVEREFPDVKLIVNKRNLGFSAGNNKGVAQTRGEYLLFLNPDTIVPKETLKRMVDFMKTNPGMGAATCRVDLANGQLDEACHRGFPTPWRAFCHFSGLEKLFSNSRFFAGYTLGFLPLDKVHEIDSGTGAFLLVRRKAGEAVNWWDEDYFWYGEDLDFCYKLKERGWKIFYNPEVKITHYKGISSGIKKHTAGISTATKETKKKAALASTQAMRIFYQKHYFSKYPKLISWLILWGVNFLERKRLAKIG